MQLFVRWVFVMLAMLVSTANLRAQDEATIRMRVVCKREAIGTSALPMFMHESKDGLLVVEGFAIYGGDKGRWSSKRKKEEALLDPFVLKVSDKEYSPKVFRLTPPGAIRFDIPEKVVDNPNFDLLINPEFGKVHSSSTLYLIQLSEPVPIRIHDQFVESRVAYALTSRFVGISAADGTIEIPKVPLGETIRFSIFHADLATKAGKTEGVAFSSSEPKIEKGKFNCEVRQRDIALGDLDITKLVEQVYSQ